MSNSDVAEGLLAGAMEGGLAHGVIDFAPVWYLS
jgi:hypothetical protein